MSAEADFHAQNMRRVSELNCPSSVSFREQVTTAVGRDLPEVSLDLMAVPAAQETFPPERLMTAEGR